MKKQTRLVCPKCGEGDRICLHEWMGAYDGWLTLECRVCDKQFHRINMKPIIEEKQPIEWGDVFFKTRTAYFKNLKEITKEQFYEQ